jgi:hypothetical protein
MTDAPVRELCGPRPADVEEIWIVELRRHATSKEIVKLCELIHQPRTPWSGLNTHRGIVMPLVRVKCFMTRLDEESHIRKLAFYEIGNCSLVHHDPAQIYPIGGNSLQTEILFLLNRIYLPSHSPSGNNIAFLELKCAAWNCWQPRQTGIRSNSVGRSHINDAGRREGERVRGSLLGLPALFGNQPYTMTGEASWDAEIVSLGTNEFAEPVDREPHAVRTLKRTTICLCR